MSSPIAGGQGESARLVSLATTAKIVCGVGGGRKDGIHVFAPIKARVFGPSPSIALREATPKVLLLLSGRPGA